MKWNKTVDMSVIDISFTEKFIGWRLNFTRNLTPKIALSSRQFLFRQKSELKQEFYFFVFFFQCRKFYLTTASLWSWAPRFKSQLSYEYPSFLIVWDFQARGLPLFWSGIMLEPFYSEIGIFWALYTTIILISLDLMRNAGQLTSWIFETF